MSNLISALKAMADEQRMNILVVLTLRGAVCVSHLQEAMRAPQPTVSRYLSILRSAGLLEAERKGQWVHYKLTEEEGDIAIEMIRKCADQLKDTTKIKRIMERLDKIEQQPALTEDEESRVSSLRKANFSDKRRMKTRKRATKVSGTSQTEVVFHAEEPDADAEGAVKDAISEKFGGMSEKERVAPIEEVQIPPPVEHTEILEAQPVKKGRRVKKEQPPSLFDL